MGNESRSSFFGRYSAVIGLVRLFFNKRDYLIIGGASLAWMLRALAGSVMFPLSIGIVVNHLNEGGQGLPLMTLTFLILSLSINLLTEWVFRPYNYLFARKISEMRKHLADTINKMNSASEASANKISDDLIGKLTSDVDFVMWNLSGVIATIIPNLLTASLAVVTIAYTNLPMAGISTLILPLYLLVVRKYSNEVFNIRMEERRIFSRIIKMSGDVVNGYSDNNLYDEALNSWNKVMHRQITIDRVYWTYALFFMGVGPIILLFFGVHLVNQSLLSVGNLVTIVLAANNIYWPIAALVWGFALLSQTVPAAKRIEETLDMT